MNRYRTPCDDGDLRMPMLTLVRVLIAAWLFVGGEAFAEDYPVKPIKLIVPYPAGGGTDIAARWLGQKLSESLHQQIVVDNRAGANGNLGTNAIAKSAPDGYLIGMATPGPVTVGRSLYPDLPYDPQKDLVPIVLANESPIVLVVNQSVPAKSLQELISLAKAKPGVLTAALVSAGSVPHLLTELLKAAAGIEVLNVPCKGGGPAAMDVVGGSGRHAVQRASAGPSLHNGGAAETDCHRQRCAKHAFARRSDRARGGLRTSYRDGVERHRRAVRDAAGHHHQAQR